MANLQLMPHQYEVLRRTERFNRVAYYIDMGLGKTFLGAEKMWQLNNAINLLICQKSKIYDWIEHFGLYYPDCIVFNLTDKKEAAVYQDVIYEGISSDRMAVGVINYELAFRRPYLAKIKDFTLVLDESSLINNEQAKRSKFILRLHPESVILLSGTPTAGKYERLWSQCKLLGWDITKRAFYDSYIVSAWLDVGGFSREIVTGYKNVGHLKKKLAEYGAIFMKTDEVLTLPAQIEQHITVPATTEYRYFMKNSYLMLDTLNLCQFKEDSDFNGKDVPPNVELVGGNSLTKLLYARQLCGQYHKAKLQSLYDLVVSTEDRLIIFYNFTEELQRMQAALKPLNRPYSAVNGTTKDLTAYHAADNSITFIQYQAGAMGGNYQKANKIIYFTLPLGKGSCDMWEQSKKRIHRIGQNKPCFYYYLLVKNSIEVENLEALQIGKDLTNDLFTKFEQNQNR